MAQNRVPSKVPEMRTSPLLRYHPVPPRRISNTVKGELCLRWTYHVLQGKLEVSNARGTVKLKKLSLRLDCGVDSRSHGTQHEIYAAQTGPVL
jgi:hypothetical protein